MDDRKDLWIAFKLGGCSLGKKMFEIKGEFCRGERVYRVNHLDWIVELNYSFDPLKQLLKCVLQALKVL
jgi:hypothetical protein